jgi:hypothetical protein
MPGSLRDYLARSIHPSPDPAQTIHATKPPQVIESAVFIAVFMRGV